MRALALPLAVCLLILAAAFSASALPYAVPGTPVARDASPVIRARASPSPSPSPLFREGYVREPRVPTRKRHPHEQQEEIVLSPEELSLHLCPPPMSVCPITNSSMPATLREWINDGFECVDMQEDLTSCGGCGVLHTKYDCTAIEGARSVSCVVGTCQVNSCRAGFTLAPDGKDCLRTG